jgi:shikimate 5-dehydrogenase
MLQIRVSLTGLEMRVAQAAVQFETRTDQKAPVASMRAALARRSS